MAFHKNFSQYVQNELKKNIEDQNNSILQYEDVEASDAQLLQEVAKKSYSLIDQSQLESTDVANMTGKFTNRLSRSNIQYNDL